MLADPKLGQWSLPQPECICKSSHLDCSKSQLTLHGFISHHGWEAEGTELTCCSGEHASLKATPPGWEMCTPGQ